MEALSILIEKVWDPYMGLEEKIETLRSKMKVLISRSKDVMAEAKDAELHSSKKRKTEVDNWQSSVLKLEHEVKCFEQEVEQSSNRSRIGLSNHADKIHKEVEDLLDQGLLVRRNSRGAEFDQGHAVLNKLERACLLESVVNYHGQRSVRMHDLVRQMALHIARDEFKWMGKLVHNCMKSRGARMVRGLGQGLIKHSLGLGFANNSGVVTVTCTAHARLAVQKQGKDNRKALPFWGGCLLKSNKGVRT
ncbi:hypothetical protein RND71_003765 [Anisodus tanguticus]|uniref:Uncharacterized protein n=1 Tax=Anisodus tanguticus TaxID=243964 RepID=A0AAE1VWX4_9SOLA|nr:hypothetical protein RND71_003765 [Anisodus tanguticus]